MDTIRGNKKNPRASHGPTTTLIDAVFGMFIYVQRRAGHSLAYIRRRRQHVGLDKRANVVRDPLKIPSRRDRDYRIAGKGGFPFLL